MSRRVASLFALIALTLSSLELSMPAPLCADAPPQGEVRVVQAWRLLAAEGASGYTQPEDPMLAGYFAWRGAGNTEAGAADWSALPASVLDAVQSALADSSVQNHLERGAADLAARLARVVAPGDTVTLVLVVGAFEETFVHYDVAGQPVVALQLENFLVPVDSLDAESREWVASYRIRQAEVALGAEDVFPWGVYATAGLFAPELRRRRMDDVASLAETVLLHGFGTRFAAALYPDSRFSGARPAVPQSVLDAVRPKWREIGAAWFPFGTEPYLAAIYEPGVEAALPAGVTPAQAAEVIGAELTGEWLGATRISRTQDEAAEISRLGRLPTLSAWGLLQY